MPSPNTIAVDKLARLIGLPKCPHLVDVRTDEDFAADPRLIPGSVWRPHPLAESWGSELAGDSAVVICQKGLKLSHGTAAWLRHLGKEASVLEDGFEAWTKSGLPLIPDAKLPRRDNKGRTVWVTRSRPKIDRIACPWLIRRFIDPAAVFLFVAPSEVVMVGERFSATPFDIENTFWSHRGEKCTFDTMIEEFGLTTEPSRRTLHLRCHDRGVQPRHAAAAAARHHGARRGYRPARSVPGGAGPARRFARPVAHVCR